MHNSFTGALMGNICAWNSYNPTMEDAKPRKRAPGGGRKPIYESPLKSFNVPMTDEHKAKCKRLGGAAWVRAKIEAEPEPDTKPARKKASR